VGSLLKVKLYHARGTSACKYRSVSKTVLAAGAQAAATSQAARPHPVWGTPAPDIAKYIRLLQYLCGEELMRLRVWTDPLRHADSSRQLPVVRSSGLCRFCGSCSCWPAAGTRQEQQTAALPCSKVAGLA
jgi:hypothetical protein